MKRGDPNQHRGKGGGGVGQKGGLPIIKGGLGTLDETIMYDLLKHGLNMF